MYAAILGVALWFSYELRFDFAVPEDYRRDRLIAAVYVLPLQLLSLWAFGQFRGLLSFFRIPDLNRLFLALFSASLLFLLIRILPGHGLVTMPRGVILADLLFAVVFLAGFRTLLRMYREKYVAGGRRGTARHRVVIIGAGSTGASLAAELLARPQLGLRPTAFLDDDPDKVGRDVHGVPILGSPDRLAEVAVKTGATRVAIAIPSLNARRIRDIVDAGSRSGLETVIVPGLHELSTGQVRVEEVRRVEVEDLLGREPVAIRQETIRGIVGDRVVLVTGGGGSIGAEIVRQLATFAPRRILLVDSSEQAVFEIMAEMGERGKADMVHPRVADFRDERIMGRILAGHRPSVLFHAAAYKHVPLMEEHPWEAVANNAVGTYRLAGLAVESGVGRFVLISTDKAINPTSVMGATKRLAEIAIESFRAGEETTASPRTRFLAVRFGNVLGSSGSVIPTFRRQIARGGPLTVTHPEVTRYFMTIPEAVGLVLQAASMGAGGEIFLLDMGEPVKIIDLARQMIQLSGFEPETEIGIEITGLRPGEKLFEELNYSTESSDETDHPRIRRLRGTSVGADRFGEWIAALEEDLPDLEGPALKERLKEMVPEYTPFAG
ncbi:MAG: polysaccharide biosynthesis protein [Puniceicoccaceae bacterium]